MAGTEPDDDPPPATLRQRVSEVMAGHGLPVPPYLAETLDYLRQRRERVTPESLRRSRQREAEYHELTVALQTVVRLAGRECDRFHRLMAWYEGMGEPFPDDLRNDLRRFDLLRLYAADCLPPPAMTGSRIPARGRPSSEPADTVRAVADCLRRGFITLSIDCPSFSGQKTVGCRLIRDLLALIDPDPPTLAAIVSALRAP